LRQHLAFSSPRFSRMLFSSQIEHLTNCYSSLSFYFLVRLSVVLLEFCSVDLAFLVYKIFLPPFECLRLRYIHEFLIILTILIFL